MVRNAVEQGGGEAFVSQHLNPVSELEIGGQDQGQAFIDLRAEREQSVCAAGRKGDKAKFVEHDQVVLERSSDEAVQTVLILGLEQLVG